MDPHGKKIYSYIVHVSHNSGWFIIIIYNFEKKDGLNLKWLEQDKWL